MCPTSWSQGRTTGVLQEAVTLRAEDDFDHVILGIPPVTGDICRELCLHDPKWSAMVGGVDTVATQAFQLWLQPSVDGVGWKSMPRAAAGESNRTVVGAYAQPFHTWADFSHLADSEDWPEDLRPATVAYFLGTIPRAAEETSSEATATKNSRYVREQARRWLGEQAETLWPGFANGDGVAWDHLVDPRGCRGGERLDAQYHRANTVGSERYIQHTAGTTKHRLRPGESGFENLVLAGDWTDTGICGGCVETATISGMQAARAISGYPEFIPGESSGPV